MYGMADKGYDSDKIVKKMAGPNATTQVVIPPRECRKVKREYDKQKYKGRNVVERAIGKLKQYRRVATRYDKLADNFLSFALIAATILNLK